MELEKEEKLLDSFVEVVLKKDFLIVKETLSRIGVANRDTKTLYQSCLILHKKGKYYIVHFKEMFALDGKVASLSEEDIARRNTIANLLEDWDLIEIVDSKKTENPIIHPAKVYILPSRERHEWQLVSKYTIGGKKKKEAA